MSIRNRELAVRIAHDANRNFSLEIIEHDKNCRQDLDWDTFNFVTKYAWHDGESELRICNLGKEKLKELLRSHAVICFSVITSTKKDNYCTTFIVGQNQYFWSGVERQMWTKWKHERNWKSLAVNERFCDRNNYYTLISQLKTRSCVWTSVKPVSRMFQIHRFALYFHHKDLWFRLLFIRILLGYG